MSDAGLTVYSVRETADILRTSCQQIRRMIRKGELSAVRVGREWRISEETLRTFLTAPKAE